MDPTQKDREPRYSLTIGPSCAQQMHPTFSSWPWKEASASESKCKQIDNSTETFEATYGLVALGLRQVMAVGRLYFSFRTGAVAWGNQSGVQRPQIRLDGPIQCL